MIESIKKSGKGWLVDGNKSVPNDPRNTDCQEVLAYIEEGGIVEDEFSAEELETQRIRDIKSQAKKRILSTMSEVEQRNSIVAVLNFILTALVDPTIMQDAEVIAQLEDEVAKWNKVKDIRNASNDKEKGVETAWPL